jgi:hypothetical protein
MALHGAGAVILNLAALIGVTSAKGFVGGYPLFGNDSALDGAPARALVVDCGGGQNPSVGAFENPTSRKGREKWGTRSISDDGKAA